MVLLQNLIGGEFVLRYFFLFYVFLSLTKRNAAIYALSAWYFLLADNDGLTFNYLQFLTPIKLS